MDCSTPGCPVPHYLPEFAQTHVCWVGDAIQPSHPLLCLLLPPSVLPSMSFPMSQLFASGVQSTGASASASVPSSECSGLMSFRIDWFEYRAFLVAQRLKHLPGMWETQLWSLGWEDSPREGNGNPLQYSCLENPMNREEPGGLQSNGSQGVRHD